MTHWYRALGAVLALTLAGCAGNPGVPYDRGASKDVKVIGLVTPYFPKTAGVVRASSAGQSFGLVGALVEAGLQSARESRFATTLASQSIDAQALFVNGIRESLVAEGYSVVDVPAARDSADYLEKYPEAAERPVDAYLDLFVGSYGYVAAGMGGSTPYRPFVTSGARLVQRKGGLVLMRDVVAYNPINAGDKLVSIAPDPQYVFADSDALNEDPAKAAQGIRQSLQATTQSIATLLK